VRSKPVDRTVREVDVIEHVVKGVRTHQRRRGKDDADLRFDSQLGGQVLSHVTVHLVPDEETDTDEG
jgi:hypothetical protein